MRSWLKGDVRLGLAGAKVKVIEVVWNGLIEGRQLGTNLLERPAAALRHRMLRQT